MVESTRRQRVKTHRLQVGAARPVPPADRPRHHHPALRSDGRPGTYGNGTKSQKIDYLLLSPALYSKVIGGAVFRTGVWGGKNGTLFPHYETMTKPIHAASDHAAIYADINL